jgi:hypothetical protein
MVIHVYNPSYSGEGRGRKILRLKPALGKLVGLHLKNKIKMTIVTAQKLEILSNKHKALSLIPTEILKSYVWNDPIFFCHCSKIFIFILVFYPYMKMKKLIRTILILLMEKMNSEILSNFVDVAERKKEIEFYL